MVGPGEFVVPLINVLRDEPLERPYLLMDETTVQVLKEPGKTAQSKSRLWAQMSAGPEPPIMLFDYDPTRAGEVPKASPSRGSPGRCIPTATAATRRWCASRDWCTWHVGRMQDVDLSMR